MTGEDWLSVSEAATLAGVKPRTVRIWMKSGRLPAEKPFGKWRTRREWLEMMIRDNTWRAKEHGEVEE